MKIKISLLLFFLIILNLPTYSQWHYNHPLPSKLTGIDIKFVGNIGLAIGLHGIITRSTDFGINWVIVNTETCGDLNELCFVNSQIAYVCGDGGIILKSIDGGATWMQLNCPVTYDLNCISFSDPNNGVIGLYGNAVLTTTNGGTTWTVNPAAAGHSLLHGVHHASPDTVFGTAASYIVRSIDGGITWSDVLTGIGTTMNDVFFFSPDTGFAIGDNGTINRTTNGGINWIGMTAPVINNTERIIFVNRDTGFVTGSSLLKTVDGGLNWTYATPFVFPINAVWFFDGYNGIGLGDYHTSDGGATWQLANTLLPTFDIYSVDFPTSNIGYACGQSGNILKTIDTGVSWDTIVIPGANLTFTAIYFLNADTGFVGNGISNGGIHRTNDGGQSWTLVLNNSGINSFYFVSDTIGFASTVHGIMKTSDGGLIWQYQSFPVTTNFTTVVFIDDTIGYTGGQSGTMFTTTDGGNTWDSIPAVTPMDILSMHFPTHDTGYAGCKFGRLLKTTDAGLTWIELQPDYLSDFNAIYFTDAYTGYAGGNGIGIWKTTNGGINWTQQICNTYLGCNDIEFTDNLTGYAVGWSTAILSTQNGGGTNTLGGHIYSDVNMNNIYDAGDTCISGLMLDDNGTRVFGPSDELGYYSIAVTVGIHTISIPVLPPYRSCLPAQQQITFSGTSLKDTTLNFLVTPQTNVDDLEIDISGPTSVRTIFTPSFTDQIWFRNLGTTTSNSMVTLVMDSNLAYHSSSIPPVISGDTLRWTFSNLEPLQSGTISVSFYFTSFVPLTTTIYNVVWIDPVSIDNTPLNNSDTLKMRVRGSFDPNEKNANPVDYFTTDQLINHEYLEYTILFQNTGNDTAFNVYIRDTIDGTRLDLSTFEVITSTHPCNVHSDNGITIFYFNNILLPDSNVNEPLSHGFVKYRIKPYSSLLTNDIIKNTAFIYFDLNPPVITNITRNEIVSEIPNYINEIGETSPLIYPNPTQGKIFINMKDYEKGPWNISLTDLTGRVLFINHTENNFSIIDCMSLPKGIYLIKIRGVEKTYMAKIIFN